ncbi:hypothetical protein HNQ80_004342 [Anaerosolibacter carboniphilus]|uniref:Uncharacterized protein n=1 Tax=Anaerosolibacter carboniphilus TaxID=1417629 RepID=A0A841L515_9FIRM|nr:hypothetical protein [Anaerosolibacter carboniphilus]MBB6218202.1 hypothetical protein [Anaerosolibacter carboniphilus]
MDLSKDEIEKQMMRLLKLAIDEAHKKGRLGSLSVKVEVTPKGLKMDYTTSNDRKEYILGREAV